MRAARAWWVIITIITITGCVDPESTSSASGLSRETLSGSGSSTTRIRQLEIDDRRGSVTPVQLSPNTAFDVSWEVEFGTRPSLSLYIAASRHPGGFRSHVVYECDESGSGDICRESVECEYDNSNRLSCSGDGRFHSGSVPVGELLNERSYLILELSSQHGDGLRRSDEKARAIRLN